MEKSWKNTENRIGSKPVYGDDDKYMKTKIIMHGDSMFTNFQSKKKCVKKKHHASTYQ